MIRKITSLYRQAYQGLPSQAWILFSVLLINAAGMMVLFFLSLYLTKQLGFTVTQAGRSISIFGIGSLAGAFLGGWLSDKIGSTNVQKLSLLLSGILYIWLGQLRSLWSIGLTIFVLAAASGLLYPANSTSMARICPPEITTKGFALNRLANNIGATIGPAVGGFLALRNYGLLFWVDGLTCLAAVILFTLIWKRPEQHLRTKTKDKIGSSRSPWRDTPFLLLLPMVVIWGCVFIQLFATFPLYMREVYGLAENRIGQLIMINTLLIVGLEMLLIHWIGKRSLTCFIAVSFFLTGLGFALMPFGRGFLYAALTVAVWTFGEMLSMPLLGSLIASRAGPKSMGRYMGLFSFAFSLSMIVGPVLGTSVYGRFGPTTLWLGCGVTGCFLYVAFSLLSRNLAAEEKKE
ncbi:MAG: MFS transporter [Candidatus Aminicenantes bacterium]|nr:MAG: MFS transporter [Candidatus Aminicenantes bacterium]